jgi:hypothetical protein
MAHAGDDEFSFDLSDLDDDVLESLENVNIKDENVRYHNYEDNKKTKALEDKLELLERKLAEKEVVEKRSSDITETWQVINSMDIDDATKAAFHKMLSFVEDKSIPKLARQFGEALGTLSEKIAAVENKTLANEVNLNSVKAEEKHRREMRKWLEKDFTKATVNQKVVDTALEVGYKKYNTDTAFKAKIDDIYKNSSMSDKQKHDLASYTMFQEFKKTTASKLKKTLDGKVNPKAAEEAQKLVEKHEETKNIPGTKTEKDEKKKEILSKPVEEVLNEDLLAELIEFNESATK